MDKLLGAIATGERDLRSEEDPLFDEELPLGVEGDEHALSLDDEVADDLEIGVAIQEVTDAATDPEGELDLNWAGLIHATPDDVVASDEETGPLTFDASIGIAAIREEDLDDSTMGVEETGDLPSFELTEVAADDGDQVLFNEWELELPDESTIMDAPAAWKQQLFEPGHYETLCQGAGGLVAGGDTLLLIQGEQLRSLPVESGIMGLSAGRSTILAATRCGDVLLFSPVKLEQPSRLPWREALDRRVNPAAVPSLAAFSTPERETELVALSSDGTLLEFRTEARGFRHRETPHQVTQLPSVSDRPVLLGQSRGGSWLLEAGTCAGPWRASPVEAALATSLALGPFSFAALDGYLAFAGPRLGLLLSSDHGQSFIRMPGCAGIAAMTLGYYAGAVAVWAALSHEVTMRTDLILIDSRTFEARKIAETETSDGGDFAPALALAWDANHELLLLAGEFGVKGYAAPTGSREKPPTK